jgi:hypothetical protein
MRSGEIEQGRGADGLAVCPCVKKSANNQKRNINQRQNNVSQQIAQDK